MGTNVMDVRDGKPAESDPNLESPGVGGGVGYDVNEGSVMDINYREPEEK